MSDPVLASTESFVRAWEPELRRGRGLGILREVARGHRMAASIARAAQPQRAAALDLSAEQIERAIARYHAT